MKKQNNSDLLLSVLDYMSSSTFDLETFKNKLSELNDKEISFILIKEIQKPERNMMTYDNDFRREYRTFFESLMDSNGFYSEETLKSIISVMNSKNFSIKKNIPVGVPLERMSLLTDKIEITEAKFKNEFKIALLNTKITKRYNMKAMVLSVVSSLFLAISLSFVGMYNEFGENPLELISAIGALSYFFMRQLKNKKIRYIAKKYSLSLDENHISTNNESYKIDMIQDQDLK